MLVQKVLSGSIVTGSLDFVIVVVVFFRKTKFFQLSEFFKINLFIFELLACLI